MDLNKICWIGGPARAGKTTITDCFASPNTRVYHTDDIFIDKSIVKKENQPNLWMLQKEGISLAKKPLTDYIEIYMNTCKEVFLLIAQKMADLVTTDTVIVEGICLLPDLLKDKGISNACFLISQQEFFEKIVSQMEDFQADLGAQDESMIINNNINAMMKTMRMYIEQQANKYDFHIISVDDEHDLATNTRLVAEYFSLPLL